MEVKVLNHGTRKTFNTKLRPIFVHKLSGGPSYTKYKVTLYDGEKAVCTMIADANYNVEVKNAILNCPAPLLENFTIEEEILEINVHLNGGRIIRFYKLRNVDNAEPEVLEKDLQKVCADIIKQLGKYPIKNSYDILTDVLEERFSGHNIHYFETVYESGE